MKYEKFVIINTIFDYSERLTRIYYKHIYCKHSILYKDLWSEKKKKKKMFRYYNFSSCKIKIEYNINVYKEKIFKLLIVQQIQKNLENT